MRIWDKIKDWYSKSRLRNVLRLVYSHNLVALLWNLLMVYCAYTLCRIVFYVTNLETFGYVDFWHLLGLFGAGLLFDTTAILYTNLLLIVLFLFPLHWKENSLFYKVLRWIFTIVNSLCIASNFIDCIYFQYTGQRTTMAVFKEFGNEGGNMFNILAKQFLDNWFLVLLAFLLFWLVYKLFRCPKPLRQERRKSYYISNAVFLLIAVPLCIGGMRGGFTTAIRPITLSNARQYADPEHPDEAQLILNTPFCLIRTMNKVPFVDPKYMSREEASIYYNPVHEPVDSVEFKRMNVVVIIVESFSKQHIGFYNQTTDGQTTKPFTPFLDGLIRDKALTYQYSYANGRKSIEGMPSVLCGIPGFVEPFVLTPQALNELSGIAGELSRNKGYHSAFFHGAENSSMGFQAFAKSCGFKEYYGRTEFNEDPRYDGDDDFDGTWAIWDEEFLQFFCDKMSEMPEPFMTSVFTASSHTPFNLPDRYKGKFPKGDNPLQECVAYTDNALRLFFEKASKQPWFENTLFVITADHTSKNYEPAYKTSLGLHAVPIIFYAPGHPKLHGYDTEKIVEQADIMPTVLNYLGYDHPYVAFGQDIFNTSVADCHALHWINESQTYQYVYGGYVANFDGQSITTVYSLKDDPLLERNIKGQVPTDTLQLMDKTIKSIIQQYMQRMLEDQLVVKGEE